MFNVASGSGSDELKNIKAKAKRPVLPLLILFGVLVLGTGGYYFLWLDSESTLLDALYMTVITITTIGYNEVHPLDGTGRVFTMFIGITGIGSLFYILSIWMENLFMLQLYNYSGKRKMSKEIDKLDGHIILVGYGRVGKLAANELTGANKKFVVIDDDFAEADSKELEGLLTVTGDATDDKTLLQAGVERAKGMIVSTANPATNVFITLSAKVFNPQIYIVTRTDNDSDTEKLKRAGANKVVNPYSIGGVRLANLMINTNIVDFMETSFGKGKNNIKMENVKLPPHSPWFNKTLKDVNLRQKTGASILAVIRNEDPIMNPGGDFTILPGDQLVVVGTRSDLQKLEKLVS